LKVVGGVNILFVCPFLAENRRSSTRIETCVAILWSNGVL